MENTKITFTRTTDTEILIGTDLFKDFAARLLRSRVARQCTVVTNETVAQWYLKPLSSALQERGITVSEIIIQDGERYKTLETANQIISKLCELEADRDCPIIALGGGVICDLTGFAAAVYKRGLPLILMPTSLLAMVDACIGGKNGVDTEKGKNVIGTFYQPYFSVVDVNMLQTLPLSQLTYGLVEAIKHGLIADAAYYSFIQKNLTEIKNRQIPLLQRLVRRSLHIKKSFIAEDELDQKDRMYLNFGHTFGHALEAAGGYVRLNHGEAVGLGMLMALRASKNINMLENDYTDSLKALLTELSLPTSVPSELDKKVLLSALSQDKKKGHGEYKFILPQTIGKAFIHTVKEDEIDSFFSAAVCI